jgi:endoglucanase
MRFSTYFLAAVGLPASVLAAPPIGGVDDGYHKRALNSSSTSTSMPLSTIATFSKISVPNATSTAALPTSASASRVFQWFGVNESGAEFGNTAIPGELGKDYTWPNTSSIEILMKRRMNIFRIPILMERIAPETMTSALNDTYLSGLSTTVSFITGAGGHAVIDSHNFGRYAGNIITSTSDFQTYWTNIATQFSNDSNVIFDCNNEFHDEPSNALVVSLNQACIDGIRAAGATTQYIFVEGTVIPSTIFIPIFSLILTLLTHSPVLHRRMDLDYHLRQFRQNG